MNRVDKLAINWGNAINSRLIIINQRFELEKREARKKEAEGRRWKIFSIVMVAPRY